MRYMSFDIVGQVAGWCLAHIILVLVISNIVILNKWGKPKK